MLPISKRGGAERESCHFLENCGLWVLGGSEVQTLEVLQVRHCIQGRGDIPYSFL